MNGFSNRETWAAALHINNTEPLYLKLKNAKAPYLKWAFAQAAAGSNTPIEQSVLDDIGDLSKVNWVEVSNAITGE